MASLMTGSGTSMLSSKHVVVTVTDQGVAGARVLEADDGSEFAGTQFGDFLAAVGVHLEEAAHPLALALEAL